MRNLTAVLLLTAALLTGYSVRAQAYNISWYKIAGGGGTSTNGNYSLSGTIGQPDAGAMSGGSYSLTGGFWGMISTVQTVGAPFLSLYTTNSHTAVLYWPSAANGFALQQISSLSSTNWSNVNTNTYPITSSNGTNYVSIPIGGNQFFRLVNP